MSDRFAHPAPRLLRLLHLLPPLLLAAVLAGCSAPAGPLNAVADAAQEHGFAVKNPPAPVPNFTFVDAQGRQRSLEDFRGQVVVLNLWATWCAPCRQEMPTLDNLQAQLGGEELQVVALSVDRQGPEAVRAFYRDIGVEHLALYIERPSGQAFAGLGIQGIPATLLLDREGREIGRRLGVADWDSPEMLTLFRQAIAAGKGGAT